MEFQFNDIQKTKLNTDDILLIKKETSEGVTQFGKNWVVKYQLKIIKNDDSTVYLDYVAFSHVDTELVKFNNFMNQFAKPRR